MALLHIVNQSPFGSDAVQACLKRLQNDATVLLIEDAVYAARAPSPVAERLQAALASNACYALSADLMARGLQQRQLIAGIQVVDYAGFVDLVTAHDKAVSWT